MHARCFKPPEGTFIVVGSEILIIERYMYIDILTTYIYIYLYTEYGNLQRNKIWGLQRLV